MSKLGSNIAYSSFLAVANYIFPLMVFPYVSRVLGVANIGICDFVDSIINYFMLFSMMGITIFGTREISRHNKNEEELGKWFSSLICINGIATAIASVALVICTISIPELRQHTWMIAFGGIKLIGNFLLIEWFYRGMEQFRFITIRTVTVKILFVVSVYIFVRDRSDFPVFYLLTALMVAINALINISYAKRFVRFSFRAVSLKMVVRPFLILGLYTIITSMYTTFNVAFLGFTTDSTQVGYYSTATKLYTILLALFTGATTAIMPHMSALLAKGDRKSFLSILNNTVNILFSLSIPLILLCSIYAREIIMIISGPGYEGAILPMQIVMPLMLIIGYEQIIVVQGLMPLSQDKTIMRNAIAGAVLGIALNISLVPHFMSVGSAVTWVCCEMLILILSQSAVHRLVMIPFPWRILLRNIGGYIPLALLLLAVSRHFPMIPYWAEIIAVAIITFVYTILVQTKLLNNSIIADTIRKFTNRTQS